MKQLQNILTLVESHVEYGIMRKAKRELADLKELVALCRDDVFTDAPEYAERVTRIKNILAVLQ